MSEDKSNSISPLLYLGIGLFIVPVILSFLRITASKYFFTAGLITILVGAFHTMLIRRK